MFSILLLKLVSEPHQQPPAGLLIKGKVEMDVFQFLGHFRIKKNTGCQV
jgi:hypothetical protein